MVRISIHIVLIRYIYIYIYIRINTRQSVGFRSVVVYGPQCKFPVPSRTLPYPSYRHAPYTLYIRIKLTEFPRIYRFGTAICRDSSPARERFNPLTSSPVHIRVLHFLLAHYISAFKPAKDRNDINQQDLKFVDLHFVKSEYFSLT